MPFPMAMRLLSGWVVFYEAKLRPVLTLSLPAFAPSSILALRPENGVLTSPSLAWRVLDSLLLRTLITFEVGSKLCAATVLALPAPATVPPAIAEDP